MSPVKEAALALNLPVLQPERIRRPENIDQLSKLHARLMVVVGYGQIIPQSIIDLPELGGAKKLRALGVPVRTLIAFEGH